MRRLSLFAILLPLLVCSGCAVFNRNNTPALNAVEQYLVPADRTVRMVAAPLIVPVGLAAATLDVVLLHPLSVAGDAWDDTNDLLWKKLDWEHQFATTTVLNAPRVAVMPVIFTADFLARSSFDISRKGGNVRLNKGADTSKIQEQKVDSEHLLAEARLALEGNDFPAAFTQAEELLKKEPGNQAAAVIKANVYLAQRNLVALAAMPPHLPLFQDDRFCRLFVELLSAGSPVERMQALVVLEHNYFVFNANRAAARGGPLPSQAGLVAALAQNLADADRAIRMKTMQVLGKYRHSDPESRNLLKALAKGDDPVLAAAAAAQLR